MQFIKTFRSAMRFSSENRQKILQNLPTYTQAMDYCFSENYPKAQEQLLQLKDQVKQYQDPLLYADVLKLLQNIYNLQGSSSECIQTQEELYFTLLSSGVIYNDDHQQALKTLISNYAKWNCKRGQAFMNLIFDMKEEIPLVYMKECYIYGATLALLNKDLALSNELFEKAQREGLNNQLLGMCLNNHVVSLQSQKQDEFDKYIQTLIKNLIQSIICFEIDAAKDDKENSVNLYKLIEYTEGSHIQQIQHAVDKVRIINSHTYKPIFNLIDVLLSIQQKDVIRLIFQKASAWLKVVFKNQTHSQVLGFGRSLIQFCKLQILQDNYKMGEKIILDFLQSHQPRVSFLQLLGLTQYSFLLKQQNRFYEADGMKFILLEYEKQAMNISTKIDPQAHLLEQIILL